MSNAIAFHPLGVTYNGLHEHDDTDDPASSRRRYVDQGTWGCFPRDDYLYAMAALDAPAR